MNTSARAIVAVVVVAALGTGVWRWQAGRKPPPMQYRTVEVARRELVGRVTATGTLSSIVTVQVGTQVSGRIQRLGADFNSKVTKGQLVAKIDPQLFQAAAAQAAANHLAAQAALHRAEAALKLAELQAARTQSLHDQNLAGQSDLDNALGAAEVARADVQAAKATLAQASASLHQAQVNLSFTDILSPIDGVVISRNVDVGQTVAASLSSPTLFTIAQDLTKMQVDTNVAEADVGRLQVGMPTYFTVDSFPGQKFRGKIREIRNAAVTVQNVVTYDAVIDVDNSDLKLRPGMTANVTVVYADEASVLAIPNAALRYHPPASGSASASAKPRPAPSGTGSATAIPRDDTADPRTIWVLSGDTPRPVSVHVGLSDGAATEVLDGPVHEGDAVVVEAIDPATSPSAGGSSALRRIF